MTVSNFLSTESLQHQRLSSKLKNLMFYVHQNFLIVIDSTLRRLPPEAANSVWAKRLRIVCSSKQSKKIWAGDAGSTLRQSNEIVAGLVKGACKIANEKRESRGPSGGTLVSPQKKTIFVATVNLLKQIEKCSATQAKEIMHKAIEATVSADPRLTA